MAGRISEADRERVRDANPIERVVGEYVSLKSAGGGNLKGLCPFHDEKTASFQVSPHRGGGRYHCFGCGEGGDVFGFLMAVDHLSYVEAVQRLAEKAGVVLTMVQGVSSNRPDPGTRSRLLAANRAAAAFYTAQLTTDAAEPARTFLRDRGFDAAAAARFGCGFAPSGWDSLVRVLTGHGFSLDELKKAGLAKDGQRGAIDAFHRRLLWSIHDAAGDVVGFGARRLFDDDRIEAKYLNTGDTPLYRKSQVLFGLDLAKKDIAEHRRVVVVEGYTDVMAMHLAGVSTAVASCGTAFGEEHIGVLRRYLLDSEVMLRGEVIYTFDGDAAGQQAALKAFDSDQRFAANTFISVAPDGMDPCELRVERGDEAVRTLVAARTPLFAFAIRDSLRRFDLRTAEGRVAAAAAGIPLVARIKDPSLRDEYARELAGWLGSDPQPIVRRVREYRAPVAASGRGGPRAAGPDAGRPGAPPAGRPPVDGLPVDRPHPGDRRFEIERENLKLTLQRPDLMASGYRQVVPDCYTHPAYLAVHTAVTSVGGPAVASSGGGPAGFVEAVTEALPAGWMRSLVTELAVERLRRRGDADLSYAAAVLAALEDRLWAEQERGLRSDLRRAEADGNQVLIGELSDDLSKVSAHRRALAERSRAGDSG